MEKGFGYVMGWAKIYHGARNTVDTKRKSKYLQKNIYIFFPYKLDLTKNTAVIFWIPLVFKYL